MTKLGMLQARHLTPRALGGFIGPALAQVPRTAAASHGGDDMSMAVTFLIHNYVPVFSDLALTRRPPLPGTEVTSARHPQGGKRWAQQNFDKRNPATRHEGPRANLLKSVQSPGANRPVSSSAGRKKIISQRQIQAAGFLAREYSAEVCSESVCLNPH